MPAIPAGSGGVADLRLRVCAALCPAARRLRVSAAFLRGYITAAKQGRFLPAQEDLRELLSVFLLEKALYEITYELNNRPEWVRIPLNGILKLLAWRESR